jgi:hypothetical protein
MDCYIYFKAGTALEEKVIAAEKSLQQLYWRDWESGETATTP